MRKSYTYNHSMQNSLIGENIFDKRTKRKFKKDLSIITKIAIENKVSDNQIANIEKVPYKFNSIANQYEIRRLVQKEIKKLPYHHLEALINYGKEYIEDFESSSRFLIKEGRADFDEAEAASDIRRVVIALEKEIRERI